MKLGSNSFLFAFGVGFFAAAEIQHGAGDDADCENAEINQSCRLNDTLGGKGHGKRKLNRLGVVHAHVEQDKQHREENDNPEESFEAHGGRRWNEREVKGSREVTGPGVANYLAVEPRPVKRKGCGSR